MLSETKSRFAGKKLIVFFLTLSLLNYLVGCYSIEQASSSEMKTEDYKIIEVIFPDGKVIKFNSNGGTYEVVDKAISGISEDSTKILFPINGIKEIRKNIVSSVPLDELKGKKITEVVNKLNRIYEFDEAGGALTDDGKAIKGIMNSGYSINLKIELIKEIHTERAELIDTSNLANINPSDIKQLVTQGNELITFNKMGAEILFNAGIISGITDNNKQVNIKVDDVLYVNVKKLESLQTGLLVAGIVIGVALVIAAIVAATAEPAPPIQIPEYTGGNPYSSCPFIYSYDGDEYNLDAQPLGGAVTKGLTRSDYSKLDFLVGENNKYKILIKNEMEETQYVDEIKLYTVEHPDNSEVFTDLTGKMYVIKNPQQCVSAKDENLMDISSFITKPDNIMWQTKLPVKSKKSETDFRNHLTFAFPKPHNAKTAHLLVNAGSSMWGSYMIKEMLNLFGDQLDNWYDKIDSMDKTEIRNEETMKLIVDEELYYLNINVKEQNGWEKRGLIFSGGPFVNETHIYNLDISNTTGDTLFIQLNPALGFWNIDYLAVDYENNPEPIKKELVFNNATDHDGNNITSLLSQADDDYYIMANDGDFAFAEFEMSSLPQNTKTTIFLKTTGYYKIHLAKQGPMQAELIYEFISKPGKVVDYSLNLYERKLASIK